MAVKFQYNKTAMQRLGRDLNMRRKALPTLKAKETALRLEARRQKEVLAELNNELTKLKARHDSFTAFWVEHPDLLTVQNVQFGVNNIAGVKAPVLTELNFSVREYSLFANRAWVPGAIEVLKEMVLLTLQIDLSKRTVELLHDMRRKTTRKVNLYEKVQIPAFEDAIRRIKRFLEDEENLSRSAQKLVKARLAKGAAG